MLTPSNDGLPRNPESPARPAVRGRLRLPMLRPTPLDDKIWREMCRLYPTLTQGIPREN